MPSTWMWYVVPACARNDASLGTNGLRQVISAKPSTEPPLYTPMTVANGSVTLARSRAVSVRVQDVELFVAVAIAVERDPRAVGRPAGGVIPDAVLGELLDAVPVRPHDEDIEVRPIAVAAERDPGAVGRPAAAPVVSAVVRE